MELKLFGLPHPGFSIFPCAQMNDDGASSFVTKDLSLAEPMTAVTVGS